MIGTTLSHYTIEAELGRGGMGIVYKARDTKLDRTVAIKVLPASALSNEDDRARFYREAKAAASLTHANIAAIYQIDEAVPSGGSAEEPRPFIAMEYIDGETLDARVKQGPFKIEDAIRIAAHVAGALGAAHKQEVVHRDIKSANIMLTSEGEAKVLDFGLAQTSASTKLTRMGSTLGTVAYMSPEQARGEEVDARTDLWALGVVLYEMIAGRNPFGGDYEQAVVYSILNEDPEPVTALRTGVPMELELIIDKCLRKEASHRYQSAADLKADLAALSMPSRSSRGSRTTRIATPLSQPEPHSEPARSAGMPLMSGMIVLGLLIGALATWMLVSQADQPASTDIVRSTIVLPEDKPLAFAAHDIVGLEMSTFDVSRDGSFMVYRTYVDSSKGDVHLALRDLDDGQTRILEGTNGAYFPAFSPDGNWIAYFGRDAIYRVPREGGRPRYMAATSDPTGLVWHDDGLIYWAERQGSYLVRTTPDGITEINENENRCGCGMPTIGPDGEGVVVSGRDREVVTWWKWGADPVTLDIQGNHVRFLSADRALFTRTGALFATALDPSSGMMQGDEVLMLDDLRTGSILRSGHYAASGGGTLMYAGGAPSGQVDIIVRSRNGEEEEIGMPTGVYGAVVVSPDDRKLIIQRLDQGGQYLLYDRLSRGTQVVFREEEATGVKWASDGESIFYSVFEAGQSQFMERNLSTGAESELFTSDKRAWPSAVSPDGRFMAYRNEEAQYSELRIYNLDDGSEELVNREGEDAAYWAADWSRDGRFFTYTTVGDGGSQIFVEPFPRDGTFRLISPGGGEESEMLPDEDALIYRDGRNWLRVEYGDDLDSFTEPVRAFAGPYVNVAGMEFRVMNDGQVLLQRPINTALSTDRIEVISGFDRLVEERLQGIR